jgi:OOP family OmpA-OmpF porin
MALACATGTARAEIEFGGIVGLHTFSEEGRIGVVDEEEPRSLRNSALFGFRLGAMFGTLGAEAELGVIPSEPRELLFDVTSLTYRAHLVYQMLRSRDALFIPFAFVGAGRLQIIDSANEDIVKKDAVIAPYLGIGAKYRTPSDWGVRLDARALFVPKVESGIAFDTEILIGVYREWGRPKKAKVLPPPPKDDDPDKDGIVGAADKCPTDPEDIDSFEDTDGCSEPDNDQDQVPDAADQCPLEPEDRDQFEDDNGCPDPDNDADGVLDAADKCATEPETRNGFEDEDGCPDEIPAKVAKFNGVIKGINFKVSSADLAPGSNKILDEAIAVMTEFKDIKLEIQGHTDDQKLRTTTKFADNTALSQARAETVKAYFVGKGIEDARLVAKGLGETQPIEDPATLKGAKLAQARAKNRRVEFKLIAAEPATPTPPPAPPEPAPEPVPDAPAPTP